MTFLPNPKKLNSLQDICAAKALQELTQLDSNDATKFLGDLDHKMLQILLPYIWQEKQRLHKIARTFETLPAADRLICETQAVAKGSSKDDKRTDMEIGGSDAQGGIPGYESRESRFGRTWSYKLPPGHVPRTGSTYWANRQNRNGLPTHAFHVTAEPSRPIELVPWIQDTPPETADKRPLWEINKLITSQLLLYRIITVFGMPPSHLRDLGVRWAVGLYSQGDGRPSAVLGVYEEDDEIAFEYLGPEARSSDALELIHWLASDEMDISSPP